MEHFKMVCKICNKVISQCRCMDCNKTIKYGVCMTCSDKEMDKVKSEPMDRKEVTKHICRPKSKDFYGTTTWQCGCGMYFTKEQVMERKEKILSDIRYEEQKGVHTYHLCPYCKKNSTRSGKCAECLRKELSYE